VARVGALHVYDAFIHAIAPVGLATSFLAGSKEEWSLIRRHPSEAIFGVQLAGNKPANLVPTAEIIAKEYAGNIDFVDLNCGCPIDLVFKGGSGSACKSPQKLDDTTPHLMK
jgi:tRNA-dihydrouridine synthase 3